VFLLDRSGSMEPIADDVVGGFNAMLAEQAAEPGECRVTLVLFDTEDPHEVVISARPIAEVPPLARADFRPRGSTPLLDAMARAIVDTQILQERRVAKGDPAERIQFVTITDGQENSSREYTLATLGKLVERRKQDGWEFVFVGANQDAFAEAGRLGIDAGSTRGWAADGEGTRALFTDLSAGTTRRRRGQGGQGFFRPGDDTTS
jgi:Mg-chelatase subunit ChlD